LYKWNGWYFYNKILQSGKYLAYNQELELIDKHRKDLQKYIKKYITDIWCGNWEKAIHLLQNDSSINDIFYIASDYSASLIELAEKNIKTSLPNVNMWNHQIMRWWNELFTNSLDDNTYARLGCTIWNSANKRKIIEDIKNMNNSWTLKWNKIIFSYFDIPQTQEEIEKTKALYQNQEWKDFIFNWLQNLWIDTSKFDHIVDYDKQEKCIYISIQAKEDYEINFKNWQEIRIKKWEKFKIHKSQRFSLEDIKDILKQSWAKLEKHISEDWISIIVAKKDPKYYNKTIKIIWITSLLLIWTLWWWIGYKISEYNQKKNQEEQNKELLEKTLLNKHANKPYFDFREKNTTIWLKHRIFESSENMYSDFLQIYWSWKANEETLDALSKLMKQYFIKADSNWVLINIDKVYEWSLVPAKLHKLLKEFISQYSQFLSESGFNLIPYSGMREYDDACKYTNGLKWNITANYSEWWPTWDWTLNIEYDSTKYQKEYDKQLQEFKSKWIPQDYYRIHTFNAKRYGHYLHTNGKHYDVLIVWNTDNKKFLLAHESEYREENFNPKQVHLYTKTNWESVAKDFLENWYTTWVSFEDNN
jgi:hypothetical protein